MTTTLTKDQAVVECRRLLATLPAPWVLADVEWSARRGPVARCIGRVNGQRHIVVAYMHDDPDERWMTAGRLAYEAERLRDRLNGITCTARNTEAGGV
jgi:hypothetical protein